MPKLTLTLYTALYGTGFKSLDHLVIEENSPVKVHSTYVLFKAIKKNFSHKSRIPGYSKSVLEVSA